MRPTRKGSRGMMLIELIGYLLILGAVAALITEMVATSIKFSREENDRDVMITRVDGAISALRKDVWRAVAINKAGDMLVIMQPDGVVFWQSEPGGKLSRFTAPQLPQKTTFHDLPEFTLTPHATSLQITIQSGPPGVAKREQITLTSQLMRAGGQP